MAEIPLVCVYTGQEAWDVIWKWTWFAGPPFRADHARDVLHPILSQLKVETLLDCSCGLGGTALALAELGYRVGGSDASSVAIRHATELAAHRGKHVKFFRSSWEKLGETAGREYDCVYMDSLEWCPSRAALSASVEGIYSVLRPGGTFLFTGSDQSCRDTQAEIEQEMQREGRFRALPVCEHDGVALTVLISRERIPDGILGNRIHIVNDGGSVRIEVASVRDIRKWTWADYSEVLDAVGFRDTRTVRSRGAESLNAATKL